jgi:glutamine synthetase
MNNLSLNPNKIVKYLNKTPEEFTKNDIINFITNNEIEMLNFRYVGGDGKLKLLNFVINDIEHLDKILSIGERVDGSSLFSHIEANSSDLYVVPRFKTAFVNPFSENPTIDILCSYYDRDGSPLANSPENILKKSQHALRSKTDMTLEAFGELEFYISSELDNIYEIIPQKGYHESHPFSKWEFIRLEAMKIISEIGGKIKYGHSEVGNIIHANREYVQHEIEFLPVNVEDAADQLIIAKWVIREIAYKYGLEVSFAPKITVGNAGSGLHIHSRLVKDDVNMIVNRDGTLNETGKRMIGGYLDLSKSLTSFGNTVPLSFLRLVPHQEAPTNICWGDSNRSVLVRVPLGWNNVQNMLLDANPKESTIPKKFMSNQTIELRSPDGSADIYLLLAGMTVAARHGLESEDSLDIAKNLYVKEDVGKNKALNLQQLPNSLCESGKMLEKDKEIYTKYDVFPKKMIEERVNELINANDHDLDENIFSNKESLQTLVKEYQHCG